MHPRVPGIRRRLVSASEAPRRCFKLVAAQAAVVVVFGQQNHFLEPALPINISREDARLGSVSGSEAEDPGEIDLRRSLVG